MKQERETFGEIETRSDWVHSINEMKRREVLSFLRNPTNPAMKYLLFKDGEFQGEYSTAKKLSVMSALAGDYLIYEVKNERIRIEFNIQDAPVADAPDATTELMIKMQLLVTDPVQLIQEGILVIKDSMQLRVESIARDVSSRYKAEANREAQTDLKTHLQEEIWDDGYKIHDISVNRKVPSWVRTQRDDRIKRQRESDEEAEQRMREAVEQRMRAAVEQRRKQREEKERIRAECEEEKRQIKQERDDRLHDQQKSDQRQRRYQEIFDEAGGVLGEGIEAIRATAAAQADPTLRDELIKFVELAEKRAEEMRRRQLEDRSFEQEHIDREMSTQIRMQEMQIRMQILKILQQGRQDEIQALVDGGVLSGALLADPQGRQQVMNNLLSDKFDMQKAMANSTDKDGILSIDTIPARLLGEELNIQQSGVKSETKEEATAGAKSVEEKDREPVAFSAYFPREAQIEKSYELIVYAHTKYFAEAVKFDVQKFERELGGAIPKPAVAKQPVTLELGTSVTVVLECDDIEFEPKSITKKWHGDWTRFQFEFRPTRDLLNVMAFVRISIQVVGIEIANINAAVEIVETEHLLVQQDFATNPLLKAKMQSRTVTPYQRIFISYSRHDSTIAKLYKIAQTALGNDVFLDVDDLRTGEDWRAGLARAIDEADIFQLFWSENSAISEYCQYEWDYALKVRCASDDCEGFIRPVYWQKPMPSPPSQLSRINFRFAPFEDKHE